MFLQTKARPCFPACTTHQLPSVNADTAPADHVFRLIQVQLRLQHTRTDLQTQFLLQDALLEKWAESLSTTVPDRHLNDLHLVIGQEVGQLVVEPDAVRSDIIPIAIEAQHSKVILHELLQLVVGAAVAADGLMIRILI